MGFLIFFLIMMFILLFTMFGFVMYMIKWTCDYKGYNATKFILAFVFFGIAVILALAFAPNKKKEAE